ncbi:group I truncated hemoglobin [Methanosarcina horonobensis]|nr:group 1 truncated hemoglobin [Methanosarcina horonobensis]
MKSQIKRAIAILLAVCFLVSLTDTAVSAAYANGGELDDTEDKVVNETCKEVKNEGKQEKSLYERLGGIYAIALVVNRFSDTVVNDTVAGKNSKNPALRDWHNNKLNRLPGLKFMRTLWVAAVSGGPFNYTGKNLADAHRDLRISPEEFDAVAADLEESLDYYNVPEREKQEVLAAFAAHKNEVTAGYFEAKLNESVNNNTSVNNINECKRY